MRLTLAESRLLKESIGIISELVGEVNFRIDKDKIEIIAVRKGQSIVWRFSVQRPIFYQRD